MTAKHPDFLIVGAAKSGTTALADFLGQHPDIFMAPVKESHFFAPDPPVTATEYAALFRGATYHRAVGEASVAYLWYDCTPARIHAFNPDMKILIMLRRPEDMAFSYWRYMKHIGSETEIFGTALRAAEERRSPAFRETCANRYESYLYLDRAAYAAQVQRYLDRFGPDQVRVYIYERFAEDQQAVLSDIFSFLDVDPDLEPTLSRINSARENRSRLASRLITLRAPFLRRIVPLELRRKVRPFLRRLNSRPSDKAEMKPEDRAFIRSALAEDVAALRTLLNDPLPEWP